MSASDIIGQSVTYASLAATTFMVVFKGLPKFLEIYTAAQESLRKDLTHRVELLETMLKTERTECEAKIRVLWDRIEKMRLIIVRRVAANPANGQTLEGQLKHAYGDPFLGEMSELLRELEVPLEGTGVDWGSRIVQDQKSAAPASTSEANGGPKV